MQDLELTPFMVLDQVRSGLTVASGLNHTIAGLLCVCQ